MNSVTDIETQLHEILIAKNLIDNSTIWSPQTGGRTNKVWRLTGAQDLICKLYLDASENPLYANDPAAEYAVLQTLHDTGVAPDPHGFVETKFGPVLLYHYIDGQVWDHSGAAVADLIERVHRLTPPDNLRVLPGSSTDVIAQGMNILGNIQSINCDELRAIRPDIQADDVPPVLIHTDVVAGNLIYGPDGLRLIDWQCPAIGDGVVDVAMFLSPAMHMIYGAGPLDDAERSAFLNGLGAAVRNRYDEIGLLYHWRMAAYCLWRADQGIHGYADAAIAEIALLKETH